MKDLEKVFQNVDNVFKEVDNVFKQIDKVMEQAETKMGSIQDPWQKWFAWHPVTIKGRRRWMTTVYRRTRLKFGDPRMFHEWEYGDMFDVLKEAGN